MCITGSAVVITEYDPAEIRCSAESEHKNGTTVPNAAIATISSQTFVDDGKIGSRFLNGDMLTTQYPVAVPQLRIIAPVRSPMLFEVRERIER